MKTFKEDQRFVGQTFVAVEPDGRDPCELRQEHGDAAVRDLVARRTPLIEFVLKTTLAGYDLDTVEGRVAALEKTAPAARADQGPRAAARLRAPAGRADRLPDEAEVLERVRRLTGDGAGRAARGRGRAARSGRRTTPRSRSSARRSRRRCRCPRSPGRRSTPCPPAAYTDPDYAAVAAAVAGGRGSGGRDRHRAGVAGRGRPRTAPGSPRGRMLTALAVEPMRVGGRGRRRATSTRVMARLQEMATVRRVAGAEGQAAADEPGRGARRVHEGVRAAGGPRAAGALAARTADGRADAVSLVDRVRRRFARPPEPVRVAVVRVGRPGRAGARLGGAGARRRAGWWRPRAGCASSRRRHAVTDAEVLPLARGRARPGGRRPRDGGGTLRRHPAGRGRAGGAGAAARPAARARRRG